MRALYDLLIYQVFALRFLGYLDVSVSWMEMVACPSLHNLPWKSNTIKLTHTAILLSAANYQPSWTVALFIKSPYHQFYRNTFKSTYNCTYRQICILYCNNSHAQNRYAVVGVSLMILVSIHCNTFSSAKARHHATMTILRQHYKLNRK